TAPANAKWTRTRVRMVVSIRGLDVDPGAGAVAVRDREGSSAAAGRRGQFDFVVRTGLVLADLSVRIAGDEPRSRTRDRDRHRLAFDGRIRVDLDPVARAADRGRGHHLPSATASRTT